MSHDITDLLGKREMFWQLQEIAKDNKQILESGSFFDWMCRNYVVAQTVGLRSFMDQSKDSHSLWRMLFEILENPGVINRAVHVRMYRGAPMGEELGHRSFDAVAGKNVKQLSQNAVRADLRRLEDASERVRRFVNKRIAHRTSPGEIRRMPKFEEVDAALDVLDKIFCKYNLLLRAQGMSTCHAIRQYDWREVLWEPWVPKGSKFRPEA
ncbi:MAG: hypothetical protein JNJ55_11595 [Betaproteobacteria bacterium]|nr:hypothetical protein [Betaproteobacteria bacterium]